MEKSVSGTEWKQGYYWLDINTINRELVGKKIQ